MIPSKEELEKLAHNVAYKDACTLSCRKCDFSENTKDCRFLAKEELDKLNAIDNTEK